MSTLHRDLSANATDGVELHVPGFIDSTDPATTYGTGSSDGVFAGLLWIEESSADTPASVTYRNAANSGWVDLLPWIPPTVASGDILYADGAESVTALSLGSAGDILQVNAGGTAPEWSDPSIAVDYDDDETLQFGTGDDYWFVYNSTGTQFELWTTDSDGGGADGLIFDVADGADVLDFTSTPTVGGTALALASVTLTAGTGLTGGGDLSANRTFNVSGLTDSEIAAGAEIAVSKLADGTARQLLQTDAAGTGVEWASNIDIPGTLDVTGAVNLDSTLDSVGAATLDTGGNGSSFGGDLMFKASTQDYLWTSVNNIVELDLRGQTSGKGAALNLLTADADGTDYMVFAMYGFGVPAGTNTEKVSLGWNPAGHYRLNTAAGGTGTLRPLRIYTGSNTNQLHLYTDGSVSMSGALTLDGGVLALAETTTPGATAGEGRLYTKTDNKLYFQSGDGTEHTVAYV